MLLPPPLPLEVLRSTQVLRAHSVPERAIWMHTWLAVQLHGCSELLQSNVSFIVVVVSWEEVNTRCREVREL